MTDPLTDKPRKLTMQEESEKRRYIAKLDGEIERLRNLRAEEIAELESASPMYGDPCECGHPDFFHDRGPCDECGCGTFEKDTAGA